MPRRSAVASFLYFLPQSTRRTCRSYFAASGTREFRCRYVSSLLADGGTHFSVLAIFQTCVSTGNSGLCRQNMSTQLIVFGPMPLNRPSSFLTSSVLKSHRYSSEHSPLSLTIVSSIDCILAVLVFAR